MKKSNAVIAAVGMAAIMTACSPIDEASSMVVEWHATADQRMFVTANPRFGYHGVIAWGDGTSTNVSNEAGRNMDYYLPFFHQYAKSGDYNVTISGDMPMITFAAHTDGVGEEIVKQIREDDRKNSEAIIQYIKYGDMRPVGEGNSYSSCFLPPDTLPTDPAEVGYVFFDCGISANKTK